MTSKERMLTALQLGVPDRVPATVHQWQPFHLNTYLGGISDLDAFRRFGLDASLARFPVIPDTSPDWVVDTRPLPAPPGEERFEVIVTTPGGVLSHIVGQNAVTRWNITPLMKRHEDLELIAKYMPIPKLDKDALLRDYDALGDDGILRGFVCGEQGGCWQDATCLYGTQELIMEAADHPDWVHAFLEVLWKRKERFIEESLAGARYDLIETGGGAASSTVISPKYHREFCLPYDRRMHDALHAIGHKVVYHTCGGMMPILDLIVENGCDASETLTPPAMGGDARPKELKARIGSKVALIGGLDQNNSLEIGTPEEIRAHVLEMFCAYGPGGGYIMSPSDHFFHVPPRSLEAYASAARECVY
ncbi:MAG: uroporphyrinogen decarboxylase family protein [Chthonomonadales bacterium]